MKIKTKTKILIIINILIIISVIIISYRIGRQIEVKLLDYTEIEISKMSKYLINQTITDEIIDKIDLTSLFTVNKNNHEEIQMIDFNTKLVNEIMGKVTEEVTKSFENFENGQHKFLDNNNKMITNTSKINNKEGIIIKVPIGIVLGNPLFVNIGPKIPIKVVLVGETESNLIHKLDYYGINNALLTISIEVKVTEQVIMPFTTKKIKINTKIPLVIKMIQGKIPEIYGSSIR